MKIKTLIVWWLYPNKLPTQIPHLMYQFSTLLHQSKWRFVIAISMHHSVTPLPLVPHICVSELGQHCSDNGLVPIKRQAIIETNAGFLAIGLLTTNISEILIKIQNFSFMIMRLKILSAKWRLFCLGEMSSPVGPAISVSRYQLPPCWWGQTCHDRLLSDGLPCRRFYDTEDLVDHLK